MTQDDTLFTFMRHSRFTRLFRARTVDSGFTLIELCLVVALIALVMGLALPRLMPLIGFSTFEGAARHLATYGRAAMGHCTLMHERLTIMIDLQQQEYWAVRWNPVTEGLLDEEEEDREAQAREDLRYAQALGEPVDDAVVKAQEMQERFDRLARQVLEARARNVHHESFLDEIGPLFDHEFELDTESEEEEMEEVKLTLLVRTRMPDGVTIESVRVGANEYMDGTVEVEITPLGLGEPVTFWLRNDREEYMTVAWDPITGGAHLYEGKEQMETTE